MITIVVSDIHLGSPNSQAHQFSRFLDSDFDRLILNGDTINNLNFKKFKAKHWNIISQLREIAKKRELILIRGNHDGSPTEDSLFGSIDVLATILDVEIQEEYSLEVGDRRYLVLHGDCFDPTLNWPILTDTADWCYHAAQKVNKKAAKWLKRRVKKMGGAIEFVKRRSVQYVKDLGYQGVITGHTHFCDDEWINGVHYLNTGCWTDSTCTYIAIKENQIRLSYWRNSALQSASDSDQLATTNPLVQEG
jgi:UDP-2,3-diacylglucosamine pyrophosphatase LpxH